MRPILVELPLLTGQPPMDRRDSQSSSSGGSFGRGRRNGRTRPFQPRTTVGPISSPEPEAAAIVRWSSPFDSRSGWDRLIPNRTRLGRHPDGTYRRTRSNNRLRTFAWSVPARGQVSWPSAPVPESDSTRSRSEERGGNRNEVEFPRRQFPPVSTNRRASRNRQDGQIECGVPGRSSWALNEEGHNVQPRS